MEEDLFSKGIGNKEIESLKPKPVVFQGKLIESVIGKVGSKNAGKEVGKKLVLLCKHPDKEEPIKISAIRFVNGNAVKVSTLWVRLDEDEKIQKGSTIAILLDKYKVSNINELEGKTLETELDGQFLVIKGY